MRKHGFRFCAVGLRAYMSLCQYGTASGNASGSGGIGARVPIWKAGLPAGSGSFRRCAGIVSHRATSGMQVPTRMSTTPTQGRVVDVASSCAQMLAYVQGCGSPLCRRVAAIISRCADIVPRRAMLVVASHHVGISERRVQGLSGRSFAL